MYPNAQNAVALLTQAKQLIDQASALLVPSIKITRPIGAQTFAYGNKVTLQGTITGDIVRIRIYDKNAAVLADNITPNDDGTWTAVCDTGKMKGPDPKTWMTATGYNSATADVGKVEKSIDCNVQAPSTGGTTGGTTGTGSGGTTTGGTTTTTGGNGTADGGAAGSTTTDPYAGTPAAGMTKVFEDTFSGTAIDETKWFLGPKPRGEGGQWGGAHFVTAAEADKGAVYAVADGKLSIRAFYSEANKASDPEKWNRPWRSGQCSTASPTTMMGCFTEGYAVVRAKLPASTGAWSGFCLYNMYDNPNKVSNPGGMELDNEFYGDAKALIAYTVHDWPGNTGRTAMKDGGTDFYTTGVPDLTADFHDFGIKVTATEVINYLDGKETKRYPKPTQAGSPLWLSLDLAIQENHAVDLPGASGYVPLIIDTVTMYKSK